MKRIGGKENAKFNRSTGEWEYEPIRYVEFHCTPEEWKHIKGQLLIRDWLKCQDIDYYEEFNVADVARAAVKEIVCDRYDVVFYDDEYHFQSIMKDSWEKCCVCDVKNGPDIYINIGRYLDVENLFSCSEHFLLEFVFNVVDSIFKAIENYKKGKKYVRQFAFWKEINSI